MTGTALHYQAMSEVAEGRAYQRMRSREQAATMYLQRQQSRQDSLSGWAAAPTVTQWITAYSSTATNVTSSNFYWNAGAQTDTYPYQYTVYQYPGIAQIPAWPGEGGPREMVNGVLRDRPFAGSRERIEQQETANLTALKLLMSCLTEEQRTMYREYKKFRVVSNKGNIFEITHGRMHNIFRLDMAAKRVEEWCVLPLGEVPIGDVMLTQKMWLETDEDHIASKANITLLANGQMIRRAPEREQFSNARDITLASEVALVTL